MAKAHLPFTRAYEWLILDAALAILGHAPLQADVAVLAPRGAPAVLHLPVVHAVIGAIAHEQDAMVQLLAFRARCHTGL